MEREAWGLEHGAGSLERIRLNTEHHTVKTFTPRLCASVRTNLLAQRPWRTWRAQLSGSSATRAVGIVLAGTFSRTNDHETSACAPDS